MRTSWVLVGVAALGISVPACGDDGGSNNDDAGPSDGGDDAGGDGGDGGMFVPPTTLAETGLCTDAACTTFAPGVIEYAPQWQLYSDNATKRRWIWLPPNTKIDTSDMNHWRFPVGTKVWKEFTSNGTRVETRLIQKVGPDDTLQASFFMGSFVWNATQDATTLADPVNGAPDANGTTHDVPTRQNCRSCHNGEPGRVLGVNAMSLDYSSPTLDLAGLVAADLLSAPPAGTAPYFPLPGTAVEKEAWGYLHANCGGCHNPTSPQYATLTSNMVLRLDVDPAKRDVPANIPAYATTIAQDGTVGDEGAGLQGRIINPANVEASVMLIRMKSADSIVRMPQIGIEINDTAGIAAITAWIESL